MDSVVGPPLDGGTDAAFSPLAHTVVSSSALPASALPRALEVERCLKAQLQGQLEEEVQFRRRMEADLDRERSMRQAAEAQVAVWQETEKRMRMDLEGALAQEEQRRREAEREREQAHAQRRSLEVELTHARHQLLAEAQGRRDADAALAKERNQSEWVAQREALEERLAFLEAALAQLRSDGAAMEAELLKNRELFEAKLADAEERARLRQAEAERLAMELRHVEVQSAVQLADAENLRRNATKELETAEKTTAQARRETEILKEKQLEADRHVAEAKELRQRCEAELETMAAAQEATRKAEATAHAVSAAAAEESAGAQRLNRELAVLKRDMEVLEARLAAERAELEESQAVHRAAKTEWEFSVERAHETRRQWEVRAVRSQRVWTEWVATAAAALLQGLNESSVSDNERPAYLTALTETEELAGWLAEGGIANTEWHALMESRGAVENSLASLRTAFAQTFLDVQIMQSREAAMLEEASDLRAQLEALEGAMAEREQEHHAVLDQTQRERDELQTQLDARGEGGLSSDELRTHNETLSEMLEAAEARIISEREDWDRVVAARDAERDSLAAEIGRLTAELEARLLATGEERAAWERERVRLERLVTEMERDRQLLEDRFVGGGSPHTKDFEALKLLSVSSADEVVSPGSARPSVDRRSVAEGAKELREEFEAFRRERREAWMHGRRTHEQQEREWLHGYLNGGRGGPLSPNSGSVWFPGLRPAAKVADWNVFRAVTMPLGAVVHLKLAFQRLGDGADTLDLNTVGGSLNPDDKSGPQLAPQSTLRALLVAMDATHTGVVNFWEFIGAQLFVLLRLADHGFDFREWQTFATKSWHPNHFVGRQPLTSPAPHKTHHPLSPPLLGSPPITTSKSVHII